MTRHSRGDSEYAKRRLRFVSGLPILAMHPDVASLARTYEERLGLQGPAAADVPHFAYAVAYSMDYLVTWNCAHIANGQVIKQLLTVNAGIERDTPIIVTPEELMTFGGP